MINKYTNKQRGLLAVIMAMVMVFAGAAFVAAEVDAANVTEMDSSYINTKVESGTLTLTEDVKVSSGCTIPNTVQKICNSGNNNYKIILIDDLTVGATNIEFENIVFQTVDNQANDPTVHGQILVNNNEATFTGCSFIMYEGTDGVDGQYAVNVTAGKITVQNTDFNNKKLTINGNASVSLTGATDVYLNYAGNLTAKVVANASATPSDSELIIGSGTTIKTLTLRSVDIFDIGDIDFKVGTLKAKGDTAPVVKSSGTGKLNVNTINQYEDDVSKVTLQNITLGSRTMIEVGINVTLGQDVNVAEGAVIMLKEGATVNGTPESGLMIEDAFGMAANLESDYTVKTNAFLENDLIIPEGVTLTVAGQLSLNGKNLVVEGNLTIDKKGTITNIPGDLGAIILSKTGTIINDGTIGADSTVKVTDGANYAKMKNVKGLSFELTKEITGGKVVYTLTVSGEVSKTGSGYNLEIEGVYITDLEIKDLAKVEVSPNPIIYSYYATIDGTVLKNGTLTIGSKTAVNDMVIKLANNASIIIDGEVVGTSSVWMQNGASAIINGSVDNVVFSAKAGEYLTYNEGDGSKNNPETTIIDTSTISIIGLKGITIDVTSKTYTNDAKKSETEQMLNIYGTPSDVNKIVNDDMTITISNDVYVPAGKELVLGEKMTVDNDTIGVFITEGVLSMVNGNTDLYKGSNYAVEIPKEPTGKDIINYYTTFDDAYANIATAVNMEITVQGGYTFSKEYIIAADQTIDLIDDDTKEYSISKDGKVTVEVDGTILPTNSFYEIKGLLIVMDGASCKPDTTAYEVSSKDADGNMTYTSAERAIADAQPGETISITGSVEFSENAVIPEGVTVEVASTASITAEKDLDVAGKLVNEGTITVKGDLDVSGEVDNDNLITLGVPTGGSVGDVTVTGTFVGAVSPNTIVVNAAQFTNDDGENTYTNVAAALAAVAEMDVPVDVTLTGEFSESSDVTLVEGMKLIINGDITLDSIRLVAGSQLLVESGNGIILTTDIVAAVGTEETTGVISDAVVDVSKYKGAATDGSTWTVVYDESKATYTMKMPVYGSGAVVVEAGSVNYTSAAMPAFVATGDTLTTLKIASGATIVFEEIVTIEDVSQKAFINEGTVESKKEITFTGALVGGEIVVASGKVLTLQSKVDSSIVYPAVLAGNVTLKEYKGTVATVTINGLVYIGTAPETLGATGSVVGEIKLQNISNPSDVKGQVIVFEGSTFQDTTENSTLESTAYSVNGIALATVYSVDTSDVKIDNDAILDIVVALEDVVVEEVSGEYNIDWYAGETKMGDTDYIGAYGAVDAKVSYETVDVIVSVGPGMLVYIDDLDYFTYTDADGTGSGKDITIGTHTVTVYLQKGYEGTPAITFNGQAITDGKLVLTSDMIGKENKLVVTGATVMQDQPVVIQPSDSEKDGMELTDILLIVLVVLIVIMAIIVALRMMRS